MRRTSLKVEFKMEDVTALNGAVANSESAQDFSNFEEFLSEQKGIDYADTGLNAFILDGSKTIMPVNVQNVAYMSANQSNGQCYFDDAQRLKISLVGAHTSAGITLEFVGDYPAQICVKWLDANNIEIAKGTFFPDTKEYFCSKQVENYHAIIIEFVKTRLPYQYVRLHHVMFGVEIVWNGENIKNAKVVEEVDVTSAKLSINTASVSILDEKQIFDISKDDGLWKSVQKNQQVKLTEYIDDKPIDMGTFFIDKKAWASNIASFDMVDSVGLMDSITFYRGRVYEADRITDVLDDIFAECGIAYELELSSADILISGWLGIQSCRQALQMVCFASGLVADDSRSDVVRIYKPTKTVENIIGIDRKFYAKSKVGLEEYVSDINIKYSRYSLSSDTSEAFKGNLPTGTSRVIFSNAYLPTSLSAQGATIIERGYNYCIVTVQNDREVIITGKKYDATEYVSHSAIADDKTDVRKTKEFNKITLAVADSVGQDLLDYYSLRQTVDFEYIVDSEQSGQFVEIKNTSQISNVTRIESQSIDLTGGMIAKAKCRGYSRIVKTNIYAGNELFAGGNEVI